MNFGEKIKQIRKENDWTLEEMAAKLGTTKQAISKYERNERTPKVTLAARFAQILGVSLEELIGEEGDLPKQKSSEAKVPKTIEAQIISSKVDRLTEEQRKAVLKWVNDMFDVLESK